MSDYSGDTHESLVEYGGAIPRVKDRLLARWEQEDWLEARAAEMYGISPDCLKWTWLSDYLKGWRDTDWISGTKRREHWRCQLSRKLTEDESRRVETWFQGRGDKSLEGFLSVIPRDVLVVRMRRRRQG